LPDRALVYAGGTTTGVRAVSLKHRRRIFKPGIRQAPLRRLKLPPPGVWLAAAGGAATLFTASWLFVRSSDAPALAPANDHIAAPADALAVLDGDTLRVGDQVVRLAGIAAPLRGRACRNGAQAVDCGTAAANALAALVRGRAVDCTVNGHDDHGRPVGDCTAGTVALSAALVRDGWAHASSPALQQDENAARAAERGIWRTANRS
jgi:endonuclease YncB( thermonuclease family)